MDIVMLVLIAGLACFWYLNRPPDSGGRGSAAGAAPPSSPSRPHPDDDEQFLRWADQRLRERPDQTD